MKFKLEDHGSKGRYVALVGNIEAEMTYSRINDHHIIVDHTEVPESLKGKGIGAALAEHVVHEARDKGFKITPLCPFMAAQFRKHPEWSDSIAQ